MKDLTTYLMFDGQCRDAMTFYAKHFGAELQMSSFAEAPGDLAGDKDRIMHARLDKGGTSILMASDVMPGAPFNRGADISVAVGCDSAEEIAELFSAFSEDGTVTMPLNDTFWGARFGMLTDRFGINWMFNFDLPKQA